MLSRDPWGRLVLELADGRRIVGATAARMFPVSSPGGPIALCDGSGNEITWLRTSFIRDALPTGPQWTARPPSAAHKSEHATKSSWAPPTMTNASPRSVWSLDPEMGASTYLTPASAKARATPNTSAGSPVVVSMTIKPGRASGSIHPTTSRTATVSNKLKITRPDDPNGRSVHNAPRASRGAALPGVRFHTWTFHPAARRRLAMAVPIRPSPTNVTSGDCALSCMRGTPDLLQNAPSKATPKGGAMPWVHGAEGAVAPKVVLPRPPHAAAVRPKSGAQAPLHR